MKADEFWSLIEASRRSGPSATREPANPYRLWRATDIHDGRSLRHRRLPLLVLADERLIRVRFEPNPDDVAWARLDAAAVAQRYPRLWSLFGEHWRD